MRFCFSLILKDPCFIFFLFPEFFLLDNKTRVGVLFVLYSFSLLISLNIHHICGNFDLAFVSNAISSCMLQKSSFLLGIPIQIHIV